MYACCVTMGIKPHIFQHSQASSIPERRASERVALPTGLPELANGTSASVPAAPAREEAGGDPEQAAVDAPTRMRCQRDTYGLRCRVWPLGR